MDYGALIRDFARKNTFAVEAERHKSDEPVFCVWSNFTKFTWYRIFKLNKQIQLIRYYIGLMISYLDHEMNTTGIYESVFSWLQQRGLLIIKVPNQSREALNK